MSIEDHNRYVQEAKVCAEELRKLMNEHPDLPLVLYSTGYNYESHMVHVPGYPRVARVLSLSDIDEVECYVMTEKVFYWCGERFYPEDEKISIYRDFSDEEIDEFKKAVRKEARRILLQKVRRKVVEFADGDEFEARICLLADHIEKLCEPYWFQAIILR